MRTDIIDDGLNVRQDLFFGHVQLNMNTKTSNLLKVSLYISSDFRIHWHSNQIQPLRLHPVLSQQISKYDLVNTSIHKLVLFTSLVNLTVINSYVKFELDQISWLIVTLWERPCTKTNKNNEMLSHALNEGPMYEHGLQ